MNNIFSNRTMLSIVALIMSASIIYFIAYSTIIKPMEAELETMNKTIELFEAQVNKISDQSNNGLQTNENVTDSIPTNPQPDEVLLQMEEFATKSNSTVNLIQTTKVKEKTKSEKLPEGIKKTGYTIEVTATSLEDVNTFLSSFKQSKRLFSVNNLSINKTEKGVSLIVLFIVYNRV